MVLLKLLLLFMVISHHINQEFIIMYLEMNLEDMPLKLLDGELKMELLIGKLLIHGMKIGETMVISELKEAPTNVESKNP